MNEDETKKREECRGTCSLLSKPPGVKDSPDACIILIATINK